MRGMMISSYEMRVGEGTQFDPRLPTPDPDVRAALGISLDDDTESFEHSAALEEPARSFPEPEDSVRRYLREIGTVPLLTRAQEVELARRMERGRNRREKAISRSALVQQLAVDLLGQIGVGAVEMDDLLELGRCGGGGVPPTDGAGPDSRRTLPLCKTPVRRIAADPTEVGGGA